MDFFFVKITVVTLLLVLWKLSFPSSGFTFSVAYIYMRRVSGKYTEIALMTSEAFIFCAFTAPFPSALKYSLYGAT